MFEKEQMARNFFKNITAKLVNSGYFIATIPDANVIVKRMRKFSIKSKDPKNVYHRMGNKHYSIKIPSLEFPVDKIYGLEYGFYLSGAIGQIEEENFEYVTEYLIELRNLIKLAKEYGLVMVEHKNFLKFYEKYVNTSRF